MLTYLQLGLYASVTRFENKLKPEWEVDAAEALAQSVSSFTLLLAYQRSVYQQVYRVHTHLLHKPVNSVIFQFGHVVVLLMLAKFITLILLPVLRVIILIFLT